MKSMIFAAGLGTRLKPLTDTLPKALVPVGGKPLIEHVLRKLMAADVDGAVVNVHHFADKVEEWLGSQDWICPVRVSDERERLLETGGAVLHARPYLENCGQFLIYNVDILSDVDLKWFASQVRPGALATLLVSKRPSSRCLLFDPETMRLKGWMNNVTGEVRSPYPVDKEKCLKLAFSGIHILSDKVFDVLHSYAQAHDLFADSANPKFSIVDFYLWACASHEIYGVEAQDMRLLDVGKLDSLDLAEAMVTSPLTNVTAKAINTSM